MKNKIKVICLLSAFLFLLVSCGKDNQNLEEVAGINEFSWVETEITEIYVEKATYFNSVRTNNGKIVYSVTSETFPDTFYYMEDSSHTAEAPFCTYAPEAANVYDYQVDGEGNVYLIIVEAIEGKESIYLRQYRPDGTVSDIASLNLFHKGSQDDCYLWRLAAAPEGRVLLYSYLGYWLIGQDGEMVMQDEWDEVTYYDVIYLDHDTLLWQEYEDGGSVVSKVTVSSNGKERLNLPTAAYFDIIRLSDNMLLLRTDSGLLSYDIGTGDTENVLQWSDYGIIGDKILDIYKNNGILHCIVSEENKVYDVAFLNKEEGRQRIKLTLACIGEDYTLRNAVVQFNKNNPDCVLSVVDYWDADEQQAVNRMYNDILTGKGPDIIKINSWYLDDIMLGKRGLLEDLNLYLDKSSIINRDKIIESVYQGLLYQDKLYMLPSNFSLHMIITKDKWIPEDGVWTISRMCSLLAEHPSFEDPVFSKEWMLSSFLTYRLNSNVDTADFLFEYEEMKGYLELADLLPEVAMYNPDFSISRNGKEPFGMVTLSEMADYMFKKSSWGNDSSFIGYPQVSGNGMVFAPVNCYGISSQSAHKDKAWQFVESFFTEDGQEQLAPNYSFSVCSQTLDRQLEASMRIDTYWDLEGNELDVPILDYYDSDGYHEVYAPRAEDVANMRDMINGARVIERDRSDILNIVLEEAVYYFARQKPMDETIDNIRNRLNILINE